MGPEKSKLPPKKPKAPRWTSSLLLPPLGHGKFVIPTQRLKVPPKQKRKAPPKKKPKKKITLKTCAKGLGKGLLWGVGIAAAVTVLAVPFLLGGWVALLPDSAGSGGSSTKNQDQSGKG